MKKESRNGRITKKEGDDLSSHLMNELLDFVSDARYDVIPDRVKQQSKLAILDTVGVALAGWHESSVSLLREIYETRETNKENASLWGNEHKIPLEYAALINGTATHALDFDDVTPSILAHPSAPIVSSILPLSEYLGKSGKELITAYAVGTEIMIRVGQVMGFRHYDIGWHATSTLGTIGATAACGYLLGINREKLANAIAISASMAGGLQKNFGTMTKPLHVGLTAQHAIQSVLIGSKGFTANQEIFDLRGFFNAFGCMNDEEYYVEKAKKVQFGKPFDYQINGLSVKKFPCCYATHRLIQGAIELKEEFNVKINQIENIKISVPPGGLIPLIHKRPTTALQGKFSAEYTCLAALMDGTVDLMTFTDEKVKRQGIQERLPIVHTEEMEGTTTEGQQIDEIPVKIVIEIRGGEQFTKSIHHAPGSEDRPLSYNEYLLKWLNCLNYYCTSNDRQFDEEERDQAVQLFKQITVIEEFNEMGDWVSNINNFCNLTNPQNRHNHLNI